MIKSLFFSPIGQAVLTTFRKNSWHREFADLMDLPAPALQEGGCIFPIRVYLLCPCPIFRKF